MDLASNQVLYQFNSCNNLSQRTDLTLHRDEVNLIGRLF